MHMSSKTDHHDSGRQAKRTNMPPLTFTWPLIIALSACGGGGAGSGSKPTVSITTDPEVEDTRNKIYFDPNSPSINSIHRLSLSFSTGQEVSFEMSEDSFHVPSGASYELEVTNLPRGLKLVKHDDGNYFIEGKAPNLSALSHYVISMKTSDGQVVERKVQWIVSGDPLPEPSSYPEFQPSPSAPSFPDPFTLQPNVNHLTVIRQKIPDITLTLNEGFKINFDKFFYDPDWDIMRYEVETASKADDLPPGLKMQENGPWYWGRPTKPGEYAIVVTARETPHDEPSFRQETETQLFFIFVLHDAPKKVPTIGNSKNSQMTGSPVHKDIFDITAHDTHPENIYYFVKGQDKIFINKGDVYIQRNDADLDDWILYADAAKSERLAIVHSLSETLTADDFDAHSLDASLADIYVTVHVLM